VCNLVTSPDDRREEPTSPDAQKGDSFVRATARSFAVTVSIACDGSPACPGRVCVSPPVSSRDCLVTTMRVTESALLTPGHGAELERSALPGESTHQHEARRLLTDPVCRPKGARPCPSGHGGKGEATLSFEALEARATRWAPIGERHDSVARI
jgi:hypothetical protein